MDAAKWRFYVGTSRGVLLCTGDKPNDFKAYKNEETTEVTSLSEGRSSEELVVGYKSGRAHLFDVAKASFGKELGELEGEEAVVGISCTDKSIIVAKQDGLINIWKNKKPDCFSLDLEEASSLDAFALNKTRQVVGTGGEKNDYKLWDLKTKQCIFHAKSLGHDQLQLPIPTSIRGITFFNQEPSLGACCTKQGRVLLYDDRTQRKPVVNYLEEKASYTSISSTFKNIQIFVGTTKGYMQWLDLRTPNKLLKTYTTYTGSVTDIKCDVAEPFVASVSLDRHLRVHRMDTKEVVHKVYMKQNLTKLIMCPIIKEEQEPAIEPSEPVDEEYEDLFNNMEEIQEDKTNKKRRSKPDDKPAKVKKKKSKV